jgi:UDPglucose 6-dehydrogenase
MRITIIGTGYQGLVVGTCLSETGHQVICVDRDKDRIASLKAGEPPIHEPGLEELIVRNMEEERLDFTTDLRKAVSDCLMIFLCISTPIRDDGKADVSRVFDAAEQIAGTITGYRIIANKGTCPPGTAEEMEQIIKQRTDHPVDVVANPDFLKEGAAIDDFMRPDRIVIGCEDVRVREIMKELYSPFLRTGRPFLCMNRRSAEMAKYATNVMLATRISLMNELADICAAWNANISDVRESLAADYRIGSTFLFPGLGFGGSGLPKDLATCIYLAREKGIESELIRATQDVNLRRRRIFLKRIRNYYGEAMRGKRIAFWGASFKPRTDDLRNAPALDIIDGLLESGAELVVFDPVAAQHLRDRYGNRIALAPKYYAALEGAHGLVIATEWNEFRRPNYERMSELMAEKVIFDGRNLYTPKVLAEHGFRYFSIGRNDV